MNNTENKRSSVFAISIMALAEANVNNTIGMSSIRVQGVWDRLPASEIEYSEKQKESASSYDVNLRITVTDTSQEVYQHLLALSSVDVICRLHTTSCMDRVLGTDDVPVRFTVSRDGQPQHIELKFKGEIPEPSKLLQSF